MSMKIDLIWRTENQNLRGVDCQILIMTSLLHLFLFLGHLPALFDPNIYHQGPRLNQPRHDEEDAVDSTGEGEDEGDEESITVKVLLVSKLQVVLCAKSVKELSKVHKGE